MAGAEAAILEQAAAEEFNRQCNAVDAAGRKEFGDGWTKAKQDLGMLGDFGGIPDSLVHAALATDDPARTLIELSRNLDMATDMLEMPPIQRGVAIGRLIKPKAARTPAPLAPSPPPARKPIADDLPRDSDSDEEWNRKEELRERRLLEARRKGRN
jgi:hypothetical protein